ncbi:hypothetical protein LEP1GSC188_0580 [Leptospira weilii serovar Topaz str. LT2116]|uniref:Uncharacterized protein n=1 Tax=Leptospira weilii serovar Topaz str. LT2116 TaxID=1088540 RepID=M3GEV1_9LEPT|nr:hypothetical protein LEP1GSC188_0580 [Leptospira weilii serovar Topaz str. LT2116]
MDTIAGAQAAMQTIAQCVSTINLNEELQYHEEDHGVSKKK